MDEYPIGFRFKPKDEELIKYYLVPSLRHLQTVPNDRITVCDVYMCHPDTLTKEHKGTDQEEWYFLSPRSRMYGNGVRPARKTRDGRGRWKASTAAKEVEEKVVYKGITFCRSVLNYFEGVPKNEVRTKWIMLELRVPCFEIKLDNKAGPKNMLDEYVVCKIYVSPQHKKKGDADDEEGTSGSSACEDDKDGEEEEQKSWPSPTQHAQATAGSSMLSEKQAGKRPMLDKVRPAGSQGLIASTQGQGSSSTSNNGPRTEASCYGVPPGQPTGAHRIQAPPQAQRQARAFNGQRLIVQQPTQQTPSFSHARDHPGQTTATTMTTTRPLNSPGTTTAFRPQVSLQCFYDKNYRGVKPPPAPGNKCSSQSQMPASSFAFMPRPQQQPFFSGDSNRRVAAAAPTPGGMAYSSYPYQATTAGNGGAANGSSNGAPRFNVNAEQYFVDLATTMINPSLTGARTQTAPTPGPARLVEVELPAPAVAGAAKVKTETEETPGFNKKYAV